MFRGGEFVEQPSQITVLLVVFVYLLGGCVLRFLILLHLFGLSWVLLASCLHLALSLLFRRKTLAMTKDLTAVTVLMCSRRHVHFSCVSNEVQRQ